MWMAERETGVGLLDGKRAEFLSHGPCRVAVDLSLILYVKQFSAQRGSVTASSPCRHLLFFPF